jgi:MFS transporter, YNFM family, putative membrane transport protein
MTTMHEAGVSPGHANHASLAPFRRTLVIGLIAFLTLVDLFAAQAILPSLAAAYGVSPAAMGFAVNAATIGMAAAGILVALVARRIDRRQGIWISLALLCVPTALLATMPDLIAFAALRIVQGVFMSAAFTLTMAYLAEHCSAEDTASALAAYVTGNVASNLFGRMLSAAIADHLGLEANFLVFALLNLCGAVLVFATLSGRSPMATVDNTARSGLEAWRAHLSDPALRSAFGLGFLILFTFIGTFTYVNFALVQDPLNLSPMSLGLVYLVFLPACLTTPLAGGAVARFGLRAGLWCGLVVAGFGLALLISASLPTVLVGLGMVAVGTFFAQAIATGFVSRAATVDRGAASGIYLASYYLGGLVGSILLGQVYDRLGWPATVAAIALSLLLAAVLAGFLNAAAQPAAVAPAAGPPRSNRLIP